MVGRSRFDSDNIVYDNPRDERSFIYDRYTRMGRTVLNKRDGMEYTFPSDNAADVFIEDYWPNAVQSTR